MKLPGFLQTIPKAILIPAAVVAALIVVGGAFALSGGGSGSSASPTPRPLTRANLDVAPTAVAATPTAAQPTEVPFRTDCNAIRGTQYQSDAERSWFIQNCGAPTRTAGGAAPASISGPPAAPSGGQAPIGDRIVIPAAGVNADVWRATVPTSGVMPDPVGYFNAVWYDFGALPGFGGNAASGNLVLSGHVDCARCYNGGSGIAVFWHTRNLGVGDTAQYVTADGRVQNYVVVSSRSYSPNIDWSSIVASSSADMTVITCTGNFSGGDYSLRHVVQFRKA